MPTKEEKIEYIRQKCIEANPSIKDLVFGCHFMGRSAFGDPYDTHLVFENWKEKRNTIRCLGPLGNQCVWDIGNIEIIGREIRLADVLLAINKVEKAWLGDWVINSRGHFVKQYINGLHVAEAARYNFLKDSLSDQDEACISFLYELLHE